MKEFDNEASAKAAARVSAFLWLATIAQLFGGVWLDARFWISAAITAILAGIAFGVMSALHKEQEKEEDE